MSIELEYEEPEEAKERRIIDHFFDELGEGKRCGAAEELRRLHSAGGSLCGHDLEQLADLLDGTADEVVFPWRLQFAGWSRGKPKRSLKDDLRSPWISFASGDETEAAQALRHLKSLEGNDLEIFAGLLDDDPVIAKQLPYRLRLTAQKGRGRPKTLRTGAHEFTRALIFDKARKRAKQIKQAVGEVCDRTKLSKATLYNARKKTLDKSRFS